MNEILKDLDVSHLNSVDIDLLEEGKIAILYPTDSFCVKIALLDSNLKISKSVRTCFYLNPRFSMKLIKAVKDSFVFYIGDDSGHTLVLMDSNLLLVKSTRFYSCQAISFDFNEKNLFFLTNNDRQIMVFDHQLNNTKNIGQSRYPNRPFYTTNRIKQIAHRDKKFYFLYQEKIDILNDSTGLLFKSISIQGSKMAFDSESNLFVLSLQSSKLFKYNSDGVLQDQINMENVPMGTEFLIDKENKIFYFNKSQNVTYLN